MAAGPGCGATQHRHRLDLAGEVALGGVLARTSIFAKVSLYQRVVPRLQPGRSAVVTRSSVYGYG